MITFILLLIGMSTFYGVLLYLVLNSYYEYMKYRIDNIIKTLDKAQERIATLNNTHSH